MTREDANKKLWSYGTINTITKDECNQLMNEIYTHLESRTCENCKYGCRYVETDRLFCGISVKTEGMITVPKDFGCNRWEKKDD